MGININTFFGIFRQSAIAEPAPRAYEAPAAPRKRQSITPVFVREWAYDDDAEGTVYNYGWAVAVGPLPYVGHEHIDGVYVEFVDEDGVIGCADWLPVWDVEIVEFEHVS